MDHRSNDTAPSPHAMYRQHPHHCRHCGRTAALQYHHCRRRACGSSSASHRHQQSGRCPHFRTQTQTRTRITLMSEWIGMVEVIEQIPLVHATTFGSKNSAGCHSTFMQVSLRLYIVHCPVRVVASFRRAAPNIFKSGRVRFNFRTCTGWTSACICYN